MPAEKGAQHELDSRLPMWKEGAHIRLLWSPACKAGCCPHRTMPSRFVVFSCAQRYTVFRLFRFGDSPLLYQREIPQRHFPEHHCPLQLLL